MSSIIVVLDNLRSTYNVGSIARTCDGLGISTIYTLGVTPHMQQPEDTRLPHVVARAERQIAKTALGAEALLSNHYETVPELTDALADMDVVSLELTKTSTDIAHYTPTRPIALIVGNEVTGVQPALLEASSNTLHIPMHGSKESFNVASASAIALYVLQQKFAKLTL